MELVNAIYEQAEQELRSEAQHSYYEEKHYREEMRNDEDYTDAKYEMN